MWSLTKRWEDRDWGKEVEDVKVDQIAAFKESCLDLLG